MAEHLNYRKRVVDSLLTEKLEAIGAVLVAAFLCPSTRFYGPNSYYC